MNNCNASLKRAASVITLSAVLFKGGLLWASAGTEGASFLDIPVGAGPAALGSAYTALATNAYAPVWNPAGLARLGGNELAGQHLSYLDTLHYEYASFVHPFAKNHDSGTQRGIGFSVQYLGSGDITGRDGGGTVTGDFSSYYASYNLAYGQTISDKLALGVTGKIIRAKLDDVSASAYAADVAALYELSEKARLGLSVVNMGSKLKFISEGDSLPLAVKLGGAWSPNSRYLASSEVVYRKSGLASLHLGGQWRPTDVVALRVGYRTDTSEELSALAGFSTGVGLYVWGQEFAYAWSPYGELGDTHYLSLLIRFGAAEERKRNLIQYKKYKQYRSVQGEKDADATMPEYQQLMQLLSEDDSHLAATQRERNDSAR